MNQTTMRRLGAAAVLMTGAVFLSRVIGFAREAFIAARFGATPMTDAYVAAFTLPEILNYFVAGGTLSITFLPVYARYLVDGDEAGGNSVLSTVLTITLAALGVGVALGELFAGPLVGLFFHPLRAAAFAACVRYTRILLPAQLFFVAGGILSATLFARGRFVAAAVAPLLYNVGIIAGGAVLGGWLGVEGLAWGALAGAFAGPFLVPCWDAVRAGAHIRPNFAARHPDFLAWLRQTLPLMIGVSLVTADDWILRALAGSHAGAITRLNYAKRLVGVPIAVAAQAVGQASTPFFTRLFAEGKRSELAETFLATVRGAGVVALLAAGWMMGLAEPAIDLLFRRGRFTIADVGPTAVYLAIFAAAVPLWSVQGLTARLFYAARDTLTPMVAGTIVTLAALPLYGYAFVTAGPAGLAIASGLGILAHTVVLVALAPRLLSELGPAAPPTLRRLGSAAVLSVVAGGAAWAASRVIHVGGHVGDFVRLAVGTMAFLAVMMLLAAPLGVEEPGMLWHKLRRRVRRRASG